MLCTCYSALNKGHRSQASCSGCTVVPCKAIASLLAVLTPLLYVASCIVATSCKHTKLLSAVTLLCSHVVSSSGGYDTESRVIVMTLQDL